jgi:mRNA interferase RelE/StbE
MINLEALQSVRLVTVKGKRLAVLNADDKAIKNLEENPPSSNSKQLTVNITDKEVWHLRIDNWRIIYGIKETDRTIGVIAVRKRPPYEYEDLQELLNLLELD